MLFEMALIHAVTVVAVIMPQPGVGESGSFLKSGIANEKSFKNTQALEWCLSSWKG